MKIKHEREPWKECFWERQTIYLFEQGVWFERQEPCFVMEWFLNCKILVKHVVLCQSLVGLLKYELSQVGDAKNYLVSASTNCLLIAKK